MALEIAEIHQSLHTEIVLFGMNHCEAGEAILRIWGFPGSLLRIHEMVMNAAKDSLREANDNPLGPFAHRA
jgi:HD-like signal output (HDOD) protein